MKNFIFKSNESDLQKMFTILDTIQKNVLYLTYRIDALLKKTNAMLVDKGLQKQVDEYFEETSPQTDNEDKEPDWLSPLDEVTLALKRHSFREKVELRTLDMLMKDLNTLVEHMDSIRTLNHTFQRPILTNTNTNPTNELRGT